MSRVPQRNADLHQNVDRASVQSAPSVQSIAPDAVVELARLLARAAARRAVREHSELHTPTEARQPERKDTTAIFAIKGNAQENFVPLGSIAEVPIRTVQTTRIARGH
jgi:hypothetical protein